MLNENMIANPSRVFVNTMFSSFSLIEQKTNFEQQRFFFIQKNAQKNLAHYKKMRNDA